MVLGVLLANASTLHGQTILIDNDFESVTIGSYSSGDAYGTAPELGNASLQQPSTVDQTAGVGGSAGITFNNGGVSSRSEHAVTIETSFDFYFKYGTDTRNDMFLVVGWSKLPTNSLFGGTSPTKDNSYYLGLERQNGANELGFASGFGSGGSLLTGSPTFTLTNDDFYRFTGTIQYDSSGGEWLYTDLSLQNYGVNGTSAGAVLASGVDLSVDPGTDGSNIVSTGTAFFNLGANEPRGGNNFDNVLVSAVPEPTSVLLFAAGAGALLLRRQRRS